MPTLKGPITIVKDGKVAEEMRQFIPFRKQTEDEKNAKKEVE
jgi:hypothetical protein